jgi:hypothetical protein
MKNIHVLPTEKPSRLFKVSGELKLTRNFDFYNGSEYQHIYITSDEEIKEGDWVKLFVKHIDKEWVHKVTKEDLLLYTDFNNEGSKIILTTDQDLISDGVQSIDDEFLEWFVNNPSCEEVEVKKRYSEFTVEPFVGYKIIIPQEEPKDLAYWKENAEEDYMKVPISVLRYITELEERMYSEQEVLQLLLRLQQTESYDNLYEWFEQFKKK